MILQLNAKKYDQLFLKAMLPGHMANIKIFAGQSNDGHRWMFIVPDSLIKWSILCHLDETFGFNTKTSYVARLRLSKEDQSPTPTLYDERIQLSKHFS